MKEVRPTGFPTTTKFVTAREFNRHTGALLDAVADGARLVVTRRGLPLAVVEPTEDAAFLNRARLGRSRAAIEAIEERSTDAREPFDLGSLTVDGYVLVALESFERMGNIDGVITDTGLEASKAMTALGYLEIRGLLRRTMSGTAVTEAGLEAVQAFRALDGQGKQAILQALDDPSRTAEIRD